MQFIDGFLNRITMYRLTLLVLAAFVAVAFGLSLFGALPYSPAAILFSLVVVTGVAWAVNRIFARVFRVPANVESVYITALILVLIIDPPSAANLFSNFWFLFWAAALAMASKYLLAVRGKHLFNPAAVAVVITGFALGQFASWWVGSAPMLIAVIVGGFLVVRKVQRSDVVMSFLLTTLIAAVAFTFTTTDPFTTIYRVVTDSPLIFFATIMLTEPFTMPPTRNRQIVYGALVGFLFTPQVHLGTFYLSPELALVIGNVFSYLASPKGKYILTLSAKRPAAEGIFDFIFSSDRRLDFLPGQYLEWTLDHDHPDSRGNRRYFTIASSPTEKNVLLGVKFYDRKSSFKRRLLAMERGDTIIASQLAGGFVLPKDRGRKLAFVAGGIGITPFRSMLKYLIDRGEKRSIVVIYSNASAEEVAYYDVLKEAGERLGVKTVFTFTDRSKLDPSWKGHVGHIDAAMIVREVPDLRERLFYVSGPPALVDSCEHILKDLDVPGSHVKTDFFPGLA
jgi:ferredoxin-NADP reductase/Na+-translocating ferredoxin:NAD+ oxidoreductase RnfD subunit